jgi:small subunit ribosomal protein S20
MGTSLRTIRFRGTSQKAGSGGTIQVINVSQQATGLVVIDTIPALSCQPSLGSALLPSSLPRLTFMPAWAIIAPAFQTSGSSKSVANIKSAIKEIRASARRRKVNQLHRSRARTQAKQTRILIEDGELAEAQAMLSQASSALDKAAKKGAMHPNTAARRKSRLMKALNRAKG